ncbi:MAG TPA: NUDIX hydrolase [Sphingomonadaceae bacterium]|nr:NUDIX hydrolase [Sphingomonadaceae bacterium]
MTLRQAQGGPAETVWQGKYLVVRREDTWEYVGRARGIRAAVIVAVDNGDVLLVEQHRAPVGGRCLELPAGLVGDETEDEEIAVAAMRELEEETGYRADRMVALGDFHSSPGMVSESFTLLRAEGLTRVGDGGGVAGEDIAVHRVPLDALPAFVAAKRADGVAMDVKLLLLRGAGMLGG